MPQLELSTYVTQIFWLLLTFLSLWFVMAKIIVPDIVETIEARKRKYNDFILKADDINKKAIDALRRYETTLAAAKAKANEQIAQNERELREIITKKEKEITEQLKQKIAENEAALAKEKNKTMAKIDTLSKDAAYKILQELNLNSIKKSDIDKISHKEKAS